ncbi:MAG: zinc-binding dehydrogenase, partial [Pseudomonadota bacterium]
PSVMKCTPYWGSQSTNKEPDMRAAVMRNQQLVVDDLPMPAPEAGQAIVKTLSCGICGSDLHMLQHAERMVEMAHKTGSAFAMDLSKDVVMGHEFCAEIVDYGVDTQKTLKPGTRVCSVPIAVHGGAPRPIGLSNEASGGYGEYMALNEMLLLEVPNGLSTEFAALTEPMAVGLHAVEKAHLQKDDLPLVIGCGPVGLAVIAALKIKGVGPVIAADFSAKRRELAEKMGADIIIDPATDSPYQQWNEIATPEGYDPGSPLVMMGMGPQLRPGVVFECVGVPGVIQQVMEGAMTGSRAVVVGVCMETDRIEPFYGIQKELNIQFVLGYSPEEFASTLRHISEGEINVEPLITGKVGVDGVAQAFKDLGSPEQHAKILVEPWR